MHFEDGETREKILKRQIRRIFKATGVHGRFVGIEMRMTFLPLRDIRTWKAKDGETMDFSFKKLGLPWNWT